MVNMSGKGVIDKPSPEIIKESLLVLGKLDQ